MVGGETAFEAATELVGVGREARGAAGVEEGASGVSKDSCHGVDAVVALALISWAGSGIGGFRKRFRNCRGGCFPLRRRSSLEDNHCKVARSGRREEGDGVWVWGFGGK